MEQQTLSVLLTTDEAARFLRVSTKTLREMAQKGKIPGAFRIGRRWRFPLQSLESMQGEGKK